MRIVPRVTAKYAPKPQRRRRSRASRPPGVGRKVRGAKDRRAARSAAPMGTRAPRRCRDIDQFSKTAGLDTRREKEIRAAHRLSYDVNLVRTTAGSRTYQDYSGEVRGVVGPQTSTGLRTCTIRGLMRKAKRRCSIANVNGLVRVHEVEAAGQPTGPATCSRASDSQNSRCRAAPTGELKQRLSQGLNCLSGERMGTSAERLFQDGPRCSLLATCQCSGLIGFGSSQGLPPLATL